MFAKTFVYSVLALVAANQAMGAAVPAEDTKVGEAAILIATDAYYACNCPNNCGHKEGSSCKFYSGPSDNSGIISGHCHYPNGNPMGAKECVP
ncbi:hypothetical protein ACRE_009950 [Hapsidospora chrysogenum ATCC 11550]|uniref:Uncharacterized protein n=1 Tax=Hapsidospora chrysogenum (strain ATCC 11550 / CBS 779.69 / DSM 880 / IAM 14645 / JCM 23072 / IMI 49137) TaxID=857340 RepID=A0A086TFG1_HAPC1|nr:hypothetical protein ACRE_009950 [Hapsidospora chrysogenum ATCC 11550]